MSKRTVSIWAILVIILIVQVMFELNTNGGSFEPSWLLNIGLVIIVGYLQWRVNKKAAKLSLANEALLLMNELLQMQESDLRNMIDTSPNIVMVFQKEKVVYANPAAIKFLGFSEFKELFGNSIYSFFTSVEDRKRVELAMLDIKEKGKHVQFSEYMITTPQGEDKCVEGMGSETSFLGKKALMVIAKDVTEKRRSIDKITKLAYFDSLTGLPNRMKLLEMEEEQQFQHVLFLDLDRFKLINDTMGHYFGDILLRKIGERLQAAVEGHGEIYRYAGDEFIILVPDEEPTKLARSIIASLKEPFYLNEQEIYVSTSIGISTYPKDGENLKDLIKNADVAMYVAKELGRNNYHLYDASYRLKNVRRITLENGLRKALNNEEFTIHYQPQVDLSTGEMVGVEALLRWEHPELGSISPAEFIPIAEDSDLITHIGSWVLMKACEQAVAWQKEGYPPITLAVNISARQLQTKYQFVQTVKAILGITKLDPTLLELEVTEGMMKDIKAAMPVLQELKGLGIQVSIDDFGTGYSALNLLRQFPIDKLKIDQSFIRESMENKVTASLIKTMIAMGHDLNFHVIAEGIETKDQLLFLKENKCHAGQGYLYSRPVPADQIIPLLKNTLLSY